MAFDPTTPGNTPPEAPAPNPYRLEPLPPPAGGPATPPAPRRKPRRRLRATEVALIALSLVMVLLLLGQLLLLGAISAGAGALLTPDAPRTTPPAGSFSVLYVQGSLVQNTTDSFGRDTTAYRHNDTIDYIKKLADNADDKGLLLYLNTPGGGLYESDELYRALMDYKETTGRPVWAYMGQICASGGYYACMAADKVMANYNTTTGSIGVYITLTDTSGLYEKLGIRTVLVRSGSNKGVGTAGVPITPEQEAVYQASVEESYARFIELVAQGRSMPLAEAEALSDGRSYTAKQAEAAGLIDGTDSWDNTLSAFEEQTGGTAFYPGFASSSTLSQLLGAVRRQLPRSEAETALALAEALPQGVPLAHAPELANY